MDNQDKSTELLETAVQEALATPEPTQIEREPYLFEKVGRRPLKGNKFPVGVKPKPDLQPKFKDGQIVDLHKPGTVINRFTKKPEIVGVPIKVKDEKAGLKFWTDAGLVTSAENYKFWEDRHAFNNIIKKPK